MSDSSAATIAANAPSWPMPDAYDDDGMPIFDYSDPVALGQWVMRLTAENETLRVRAERAEAAWRAYHELRAAETERQEYEDGLVIDYALMMRIDDRLKTAYAAFEPWMEVGPRAEGDGGE